MSDTYDLDRFVQAQNPVFEQVKRELGDGRKQTHWMWFIFPQLAGLGRSEMAQRYALRSLEEAEAYLRHDWLGPRLIECTNLVNKIESSSAHNIFGSPDDLKFRSCVTLFAQVSSAAPQFKTALFKYFDDRADDATLWLLQEGSA